MCRTLQLRPQQRIRVGSEATDCNRPGRRLRKVCKVRSTQELIRRSGDIHLSCYEFLKCIDNWGLLGERLFIAFDCDGDGFLSAAEFSQGFLKLYKGNGSETATLLFAMIDFACKGSVGASDVNCFLQNLPRTCSRCGAGFDFSKAERLAGGDIEQWRQQATPECTDAILAAIISTLPQLISEITGDERGVVCDIPQTASMSDLKCLRFSGRKYFFTMRCQALFYYASVDTARTTGIIPIQGLVLSDEDGLGFMLKSQNTGYLFEAESEGEKKDWMDRIRQELDTRCFDDFYTLQEPIWIGNHSRVYKAQSRTSEVPVAVKIIEKEPNDSRPEWRCKREFSILRTCRHPNVLQSLDCFETLDKLFLVTEYLAEGSLYDYLECRDFSVCEEFARTVVSDVARALESLHARGVVHRDVKPENVLLKSDGQRLTAVVIDFDLACFLGPEETTCQEVGTLQYAAPEVILQQEYRERVDWWSLGVLMHVMVTGTIPFSGSKSKDVINRVLKRRLSFAGPEWGTASKAAVAVVSGLLCRNPAGRLSPSALLDSDWARCQLLQDNDR